MIRKPATLVVWTYDEQPGIATAVEEAERAGFDQR
jgi:hypothetical protein